MFTYEAGVFLAVLLWLWSTLSVLVSINSLMNRNLKKIGQRLSWLSLQPKPISHGEILHGGMRKTLRFLFLCGIGLPFVLLSWIYVAYSISYILYRWRKDAGAPQAVREFRWKMKNIDMSFDQIVKEMMKANDQDLSELEMVKGNIISEMREQGLHP